MFSSNKWSIGLLIAAFTVVNVSFAQNLVLNPSFESVTTGSLQCSWYTSAAQFNNVIANWTVPTGGSTDIFHTSLATTCYCSPYSTNGSSPGQQAPRTGNGFVNIVTWGSGGCTPYREYIQGQLSTPLVAGQTYEVEMYVSLADNMARGTNNIGVKFSNTQYWNASMCGYYTTPDLNYTGPIITDKNGWTQILFCYTPTVSGQQYFIIGNFYNDAATSTVLTPPGTGTTIRYFIDDVRVELVGSSTSAGTNGTANACSGTASFNLFDNLGGSPSTGGTWSGPSTLTGGYLGTFNPATNLAGTYTYTTGSGGCIPGGSAQVTVTIPSPADASFTAPAPMCETAASVQLTGATSGGTWSGTGITNATTGTFDPAVAGPGTHNITYTISGACGDTETQSIVVNPAPNATITPAGPFCTDAAAVQLTAASSGGTWSGTGITNAGNGTFNPATAGPGTHTVTYSVTASGCTSTDTEQIVVNQAQDASFTTAGPFCANDAAIVLSATNTGGTWSGTGITNTTNGTFNPVTAGPGTHAITYTFSGACGDTQSHNMVVNAAPDATISPAGPFCSDASAVQLTAAATGGTWSGTGITDAVNGTFDPAVAGVGTHTINYSVTSAGCTDSDSETITVNQVQDATFSPAGPFCQSDADLQLTAVNGGGTWSGTGITNATNGTFSPATAGPGSHTITYSFTGACGDTQNQTIVVNASPDATISLAGPFCSDDASTAMTAADPGGTWSGTGITDAVNGTFDPTVAGAGTHSISYSVTINGCNTTDTEPVVVNPAQDAGFAAAGPFCESDNNQQLVPVTTGGTWAGPGIVNTATGLFDPAIAGPGSHSIDYNLGGSCPDLHTEIIVVNATPDATIDPAGPFCSNEPPTQLTAMDPGGTWSGTGITDVAAGTFDPSVAGIGNHTVTYSVTVSGCNDTRTTQITVNQAQDASYALAGPFCEDDGSVQLSATTNGGSWSGNGITNPAIGTFDPTTAGPGTHAITYTIPGTCGDAVTQDIIVNPLPQVTFTADPSSGCVPFTATFIGTSGTSCLWDFGDGAQSNACNTASHTYTSDGCFDVTLTLNDNGCMNTLTVPQMICTELQSTAYFTMEESEESNEVIVEFTNESTDADSYEWDFGDGDVSNAINPTHSYSTLNTGNFTICLTTMTPMGCDDEYCETITVEENLLYFVPNTFTPDGDMHNQQFRPVFTAGFDPFDFSIYIFNRWGEMIWESHDASVGWDGTYGGMLVPDGVYTWKIEFKLIGVDKHVEEVGHVNVMR